jgi:hypothetical protein
MECSLDIHILAETLAIFLVRFQPDERSTSKPIWFGSASITQQVNSLKNGMEIMLLDINNVSLHLFIRRLLIFMDMLANTFETKTLKLYVRNSKSILSEVGGQVFQANLLGIYYPGYQSPEIQIVNKQQGKNAFSHIMTKIRDTKIDILRSKLLILPNMSPLNITDDTLISKSNYLISELSNELDNCRATIINKDNIINIMQSKINKLSNENATIYHYQTL